MSSAVCLPVGKTLLKGNLTHNHPPLIGHLPLKVVFHRRLSSIEGRLPSKVVFHRRSSSIEGRLPYSLVVSDMLETILIPVATLPTSPVANSDRGTDRKATYRDSSYRSAQKYWCFQNIRIWQNSGYFCDDELFQRLAKYILKIRFLSRSKFF